MKLQERLKIVCLILQDKITPGIRAEQLGYIHIFI